MELRIQVTLTDDSQSDVYVVQNWAEAGMRARIWHDAVSESACWTRHTNPVQIKKIELVED
jgi:hypothetical protein